MRIFAKHNQIMLRLAFCVIKLIKQTNRCWTGCSHGNWCHSPVARYMLDILPVTDWSQEAVRPALNLVLRRLERLFSKIYKKPVLRVGTDLIHVLGTTCTVNFTSGVIRFQ